MHMWYWFGKDLGTFLFPGFNVTTTWGFVFTCIGLAALAILYEGMKIIQIRLQRCTSSPITVQAQNSENSTLLSKISVTPFTTKSKCTNWYKWMFQVFHWSLHTALGYILMVAVMSYNAYVTIALAIGACIGYWVFAPTLIEHNLAEFHAKQKIIQCDKDCTGDLITDTVINEERRSSAVSIITEQLVTEAIVDIHAPSNA